MKAIVSVIGKDKKGIIAKVSNILFEQDINIEDISQTIMQEYFTMIMMVSISENSDVTKLSNILTKAGEDLGVTIRVQHEDIFNAMHKL
ncbi:MAG: ACT domain-containing protein [Clostridia bacterium]|nr:ACT domain-containing protein [Clostridia bacterium]